jgi:predicted Fe-S protein YdhL (DUF1289 family)
MTSPVATFTAVTPVPSPCISVCTMDPRSALCTGCLRTIVEIAEWSRYSDADKQAVWLRIAERRTRG